VTQALQSLMARIEVVPDDSLLADYPSLWPARVSVTANDGKHDRVVRHVPGDPGRPLSGAELKQKFRRLVVPCCGDDRAGQLESVCSGVLQSSDALLNAVNVVNECVDAAAAREV